MPAVKSADIFSVIEQLLERQTAIDSFIDEDKRPNINFNGTADEFREELNNLVVVLLSKNFEHEFIEFSEATGISRVQYEAFAAKFMAEANTDKH